MSLDLAHLRDFVLGARSHRSGPQTVTLPKAEVLALVDRIGHLEEVADAGDTLATATRDFVSALMRHAGDGTDLSDLSNTTVGTANAFTALRRRPEKEPAMNAPKFESKKYTLSVPRPSFVQIATSIVNDANDGETFWESTTAVCTMGRAWMRVDDDATRDPGAGRTADAAAASLPSGWYEIGGPRYALDEDMLPTPSEP